MAYVVVVSSLINVLALVGVAYFFWGTIQDLPTIVRTAIQDEVRKQDDRIEKRQAKVSRTPEEDDGMVSGALQGILPGRPVRR